MIKRGEVSSRKSRNSASIHLQDREKDGAVEVHPEQHCKGTNDELRLFEEPRPETYSECS